MNKRQYKKFERKNFNHKFIDYRRSMIVEKAFNRLKTESEPSTSNMIQIIDSRRGNLKHPIKVTLFTNVHPSSCKMPDQLIQPSCEISFNSGNYIPGGLFAEYLNNYMINLQ